MSIAPVRQDEAPAAGMSLALEGVGKTFGTATVLHDLRLAVPAGQFLGIVGRSGSGKSSLLRMLAGLDQPTSGRILFGGTEPRPGDVRLMFQEPRLLPWAHVVDNVAVGLSGLRDRALVRRRALEALDAVGLADRANDWPSVLSGGQKQRVALARALVSRPRVLLFDEPLGALDALTRLDMQALIETAWRTQGFTAVLVTHDVPEAVRLADRILLIENGTVAMDRANSARHPRDTRTPESLLLENEILARLMTAGH